jgi:protein phosphatase methylesterase 1
MFLQVGVPK